MPSTPTRPRLLLEEFFHGNLKGWGMIHDLRGRIATQFDFTMKGSWQGNSGVIDEKFVYYETGMRQERQWCITKLDNHHYQATAHDIIGTAQGKLIENAIHFRYQMDVPVNNKNVRLSFDDRMWATRDGCVINRAKMKKFGFTVAVLNAFMQKQ